MTAPNRYFFAFDRQSAATLAAVFLISHSQSFSLTSMPDDYWELVVKNDAWVIEQIHDLLSSSIESEGGCAL